MGIKRFSKEDITKDQLFEILENIYNEVYVVDKNMTIIYINPACQRHYGLSPEDFIGKNHEFIADKLWYPSVVSSIFREKRKMTAKHMTYMGYPVISTSVPVLDSNEEIEI